MSSTNNNIYISSSTNIVDDVSNNIEKLTTADDGDASTTKSEEMNNKKCTSCENKLEHTKSNDNTSSNNDIEQDIVQENNTDSNLEASDVCANCGKVGASNSCNKCKMVKYCNAACKKKHKTKHKKACERRVAELHEIELFKQPPPPEEDCPICFQRLPILLPGKRYNSCCGKIVCSGCVHAMRMASGGTLKLCSFCRTPTPDTNKKYIEQIMKRTDVNDAEAMRTLAGYYHQARYDLPQDFDKALELFQRAAELGDASSDYNIGIMYDLGSGVKVDKRKAVHYWELGAMRGCEDARYNLGVLAEANNVEGAIKHYMIAAGCGCNQSVRNIQELYSKGLATKNDYTQALRAYQKYMGEVKSSQRDEAAAFDENYQYIE